MRRFFNYYASGSDLATVSDSATSDYSTKAPGPHPAGTSRTISFIAGVATGISFATVVFILFVSLFLCIPQQSAVGAYGTFDEPDSSAPEHPQRAIKDIRKDLEAFMKNTKQEDDYNLQVGAAIDLCRLHQEIVTDPRFETHSQLVSFRAVAASRLKRYAKYVETEMKRREKEKERAERDQRREQRLRQRNGEDNGSDENGVQRGDDENDENDENQDGDEFDESEGPSDSDSAINDSMNDSMFSMGSATGGPVNVMNYLGGSYAPPWDHGFELLELIQNTINPEFWRANGGSGVIQYYRPSRVLVISATSDVHDRLEGLLEVLKWNSR